jgi:hypothetical protein
MARGNCIVVSSNPLGHFEGGYIATAEKPGTFVQMDATVALKAGRHTWKVYQPGADGENPLGPVGILTEDRLQGKTATDAYAAGAFVPTIYIPQPGDELNALVANLAGTADDHALGEKMMIDHGTGKLVATTGSPENEHCVLLEAITDPTADTLAWVRFAQT